MFSFSLLYLCQFIENVSFWLYFEGENNIKAMMNRTLKTLVVVIVIEVFY